MKKTNKIPFNNKAKIDELKSKGWHVYVTHDRYSNEQFDLAQRMHDAGIKSWKTLTYLFDRIEQPNCEDRSNYSPRGGKTTAELVKGVVVGVGMARCSFGDNYNYSKGLTIALARAIRDANESES